MFDKVVPLVDTVRQSGYAGDDHGIVLQEEQYVWKLLHAEARALRCDHAAADRGKQVTKVDRGPPLHP